MSKIAVIYWSGTGNTQAMAEAVAEGAKGAGAQVSAVRQAVTPIPASVLSRLPHDRDRKPPYPSVGNLHKCPLPWHLRGEHGRWPAPLRCGAIKMKLE